jgi:hypothetical protein
MENYEKKYSNKHVYDCIIIGSGLSGLQTAQSLINDHDLAIEDVLILESQDYIGGRVRQMNDFIKGCKIDVGAEFLHGSNTLLTQFAEKNNEALRDLYCWAHGMLCYISIYLLIYQFIYLSIYIYIYIYPFILLLYLYLCIYVSGR